MFEHICGHRLEIPEGVGAASRKHQVSLSVSKGRAVTRKAAYSTPPFQTSKWIKKDLCKVNLRGTGGGSGFLTI